MVRKVQCDMGVLGTRTEAVQGEKCPASGGLESSLQCWWPAGTHSCILGGLAVAQEGAALVGVDPLAENCNLSQLR